MHTKTVGGGGDRHRWTMRWCALALVAVALGGRVAAAAGAEPNLSVRESAGAAVRAWPVWAGVPLPPGRVRDANAVHLHDVTASPAGEAVTVQTRTLGRWPDGSVRWLGLDWQTDLAARQERRFAVRFGTKAPARRGDAGAARVQVRDAPGRVEVDTGAVRFAVPKQAPGFLADVSRTGAGVVASTVSGFMDVAGARHAARPAESVVVTEPGPLRARIEIRGAYTPAFRYLVRIDAYAGQPFVRILHTFEQQGPEPYTAVGQLALEVGPLALAGAPSYRAGREGGEAWTGDVTDSGIVVAQDDNETVRAGGRRVAGHAAGWIDVRDAAGGVALLGRYFWQEYPQSFVVRGRTLTYNLWAPDAPPAMVGMGAAKTHELVLMVHGAEAPPPALFEALRAPLMAAAAPDWVATTGALRNAIAPPVAAGFLRELAAAADRTAARAAVERWDDGNAVLCTDPARERPRRGLYGMLNWGDWNFPGYHDTVKGCDAWGNLEYDTAQVFALAYAATGETRYLDAMVAAARHFMDVDRIHYQSRHPAWVGMNHPKNPLHFSFELGGVDLGHTWNEGLLSYYALTGDDRGLVAARSIADYLTARIREGKVRGNPRQWGWPQVALVAAYEATGHAPYREAALAYARGGMAAHPPEPIAQWKLGILADGLGYTHTLTGDPAIRAWLQRYAAAWRAQPALADPRLLPGVAYVARLTNDDALRRLVLERVQSLKLGNWAKPLTIGGRTAFRVYALLGGPATSGLQPVTESAGTPAAPRGAAAGETTPWMRPDTDWGPTPAPWGEPTQPGQWPAAGPAATRTGPVRTGTPGAQ